MYKSKHLIREKKKSSIEEETPVCPNPVCKSKPKHLARDYHGDLVCQNCGWVVEPVFIDSGPDWRAFDAEQSERKTRTGAPMTYTIHDKGLSTEISWANKDSSGRSIPTKTRAQMYRLRELQSRSRVGDATERNLASALSILNKMVGAIGLSRDVNETAALIYRKAMNEHLIRGRSIEGVAAAALYGACRQCNVPRTLDEIASASKVSRKKIGRTYRFMVRELKQRLMPTSPHDYVARFCSELKLGNDIQVKANEIIKMAAEKELTSGRGPTGVSAAAIYVASVMCNQRKTQMEVAEVAGVTEVTIRNRYKELVEKLNLEVPV